MLLVSRFRLVGVCVCACAQCVSRRWSVLIAGKQPGVRPSPARIVKSWRRWRWYFARGVCVPD
ncbi:hypothetical protein LIA77_09556 [Sarocladium implicatum]|nr:hypothetical protein LIA77_09556 [Sarocladium implicatum]